MITYDLNTIKDTPFSKVTIFSGAEILHNHTFFEFCLILEGQAYSTINGGIKEILQKGDFIFLRPKDAHVIRSIDKNYRHRDYYITEEKMRKICALFGGNFYDEIMKPDYPLEGKLDVNDFVSVSTRSLVLSNHHGKSESEIEKIDQIHSAIIVQFLSNFVYSSMEKSKEIPHWLTNLHTQLTQFYFIHNTVEEIVETTKYSHSYVCKMFKKHYGAKLIDVHNRTRVIASIPLLKTQKLIDIAFSLGWENPKNYTIEFKKHFGITPTEYIRTSET